MEMLLCLTEMYFFIILHQKKFIVQIITQVFQVRLLLSITLLILTNASCYNTTTKEISYDIISRSFSTLNFSINEPTSVKQSINYPSPTTIQESNIDAQLDNPSNIEQVYTFGQSIPNRWVAVGRGGNSIAYSSDGINWTPVPNSISIFSVAGYDVSWNGTQWIATGQGTNTLAYSSNGINWTGVPGSTALFSTAAYSIAWNGTRWVSVGRGGNSIAYSSDGINWTGLGTSIFSTYGYRIVWNGGKGGVFMNSVTLNEYGYGLSNRLDVSTDKYYNQGFTNMTMTINI